MQTALFLLQSRQVDFDRLILSEGSLYSALTSLDGSAVRIRYPRYIDQKFRARRGEVMERRSTGEYAAILDYVNRAREWTVWRWFDRQPAFPGGAWPELRAYSCFNAALIQHRRAALEYVMT